MTTTHTPAPYANLIAYGRDLHAYDAAAADFTSISATRYEIGGLLAGKDLEVLADMVSTIKDFSARLCAMAGKLNVAREPGYDRPPSALLLARVIAAELGTEYLDLTADAARVLIAAVRLDAI